MVRIDLREVYEAESVELGDTLCRELKSSRKMMVEPVGVGKITMNKTDWKKNLRSEYSSWDRVNAQQMFVGFSFLF